MAISKEEILEAVGAMTVMDLNDLVKAFEEKFGVSAASMARCIMRRLAYMPSATCQSAPASATP